MLHSTCENVVENRQEPEEEHCVQTHQFKYANIVAALIVLNMCWNNEETIWDYIWLRDGIQFCVLIEEYEIILRGSSEYDLFCW